MDYNLTYTIKQWEGLLFENGAGKRMLVIPN